MQENRRSSLFASLASIMTMASTASISEFVSWVLQGAPDVPDCDVEQQQQQCSPQRIGVFRSTSLHDLPIMSDELPPPLLCFHSTEHTPPIQKFFCRECGSRIEAGAPIFCVADGRFCTQACRRSHVQRRGAAKLAKLFLTQ